MNKLNNNVLLYVNRTDGAKLLTAVAFDAVASVDYSKFFAALVLDFNGVTGT